MDESTTTYWGTTGAPIYACPNVSLFRFLGSLGVKVKESDVLEIGFGHGTDLLEMTHRGAKSVYGIDINEAVVETARQRFGANSQNFVVADVTKGSFPFAATLFDIVVCQDTIYYFTYGEIERFFRQVFSKLKAEGLFVFQFIQADLKRLHPAKPQELYNFQDLERLRQNFGSTDNPIAFLDAHQIERIIDRAGFAVRGTKILVESYGVDETLFRYNKYYACEKR